jgi:hypothetical protein
MAAKKCDVCKRRNAIYIRTDRQTGKPDRVCATCMVACKAVFGDEPSDFTRIKHKD